MNKLLKGGIRLLHNRLDGIITRWNAITVQQLPEPPYNSLAPIDDADAVYYIEALNWALERAKSKSIYNIALTGPYGSGKSSILKTFQKQNSNPKNVFLEISLATFKEEGYHDDEKSKDKPAPAKSIEGEEDEKDKKSDDNVAKPPKTNEDILRLIELSILQQIFYHEEDSKIPDSRFKKIKSFKRKNMVWVTVGIIAALLFGFNFFYPEKLQKLLGVDFLEITSKILRWTSFFVLLSSLSVVIYRSIRLLYGLQVSKLKFHEAEIEIDKNISKSILNNHLDEILYFFEVTDYSVVLIEDLDRFRQAEIFTKLRELNLLINKSKKIKQDVVFIYAVRDEIFKNKERTKFFDFIIPIIPVINASNSNETLTQIVDKNGYEISKDLIEDVGLFIDDMRMLYNVMNEYYLYHSLLDKELDQNKLLAIIIYKNIYPEDFVKLADDQGVLFDLLNNKKEYIRKALVTVDDNIAALKGEIQNIEHHLIKDQGELRLIYLGAYVDQIPGFDAFLIQGERKSIKNLAESQDLFDYLTADNISYNYFYINQWGSVTQEVVNTQVKFQEVELLLNDDFTFNERLEIIESQKSDQSEKLKEDIQNLERDKVIIRHSKIQKLLSDKKFISGIDDSTRQGLLFKVMLQAGYIDEDYLDYISLFYEGNITKADRSFLLNVKGQTQLDYDYKLSKIDNLIGKIRTPDFSESYILNFSLLEHLLENPGYDVQLKMIMSQLNDKTDHGTDFIESFLLSGANPEIFIRMLGATWPGIWKYVDTASDFTKDRKMEYLKLILSYCNLDDLKRISGNSKLWLTLTTQSGFLSFLNDDERTKEVIKALNIKFFDLEFTEGSKELGDFIYDGNYYQIHGKIIEQVIQHAGKFNRSDFETKNYHALKNAETPKLLKYIQDNMDSYVNNIYLSLPNNDSEPDGTLGDLLNNEKVKLENRIKIIKKVNTKTFAISVIVPAEITKELLNQNKMEADWSNVITVYDENDEILTPELIRFIDDKDNAQKLADEEFDSSELDLEETYSDKFILSIINQPKISDESYELLLNAFPGVYDMDVVDVVSYEKMDLLVKSKTVGNLPKNFSKIKEEYGDLQQPLLENGHENLVNHLDEYELDSDDLVYVLKSEVFSSNDKNKVVNGVEVSLITTNVKVLAEICRLIFEDPTFTVSKQILIAVMTAQLSVETRVKLFNMRYQFFIKADVPQIFQTFPYPYSDIGVLHKKPVIPFGSENQFLANNLDNQRWISKQKQEDDGVRLINFSK